MKLLKAILKELLIYCIIFVVTFIFFRFIFLISTVMSGSMEPTIMTGNTALCNRLAYVFHEPERGDKIIFFSDEADTYYFKRIIGLPGDEISFKDGHVLINGVVLEEPYIASNIRTECEKTFIVPEEHIFLLGDNRENSYDSRFWKEPFISYDKITGKYMAQMDFSFEFDIRRKVVAWWKDWKLNKDIN